MSLIPINTDLACLAARLGQIRRTATVGTCYWCRRANQAVYLLGNIHSCINYAQCLAYTDALARQTQEQQPNPYTALPLPL